MFKKMLPILGGIGTLMMFASQISSDNAVSNLASWARLFHVDLPNIFENKEVDAWVFWIGCLLGIICVLGFLILYLRKRFFKRPTVIKTEFHQQDSSNEFKKGLRHIKRGEIWVDDENGDRYCGVCIAKKSGRVLLRKSAHNLYECSKCGGAFSEHNIEKINIEDFFKFLGINLANGSKTNLAKINNILEKLRTYARDGEIEIWDLSIRDQLPIKQDHWHNASITIQDKNLYLGFLDLKSKFKKREYES